jgi:hypothetical protein
MAKIVHWRHEGDEELKGQMQVLDKILNMAIPE